MVLPCVGEMGGRKAELLLENSLALSATDTVWGPLAASDQNAAGPQACPCLPRLVKRPPQPPRVLGQPPPAFPSVGGNK